MRLAVAVLALATATATAHANGRAPQTNGVYFRPGDAHSIYVRTTFGFLISHDDGCTFNWICETCVGYAGSFDPKYAIATDGTIFATTFDGLRISRDGGCSFTTNASLPPSTWIDALDIGPSGEVWVGTATSGAPNDVYASIDNGMTFTSRGMLSSAIWWKSVKVAPSNMQRVYLAGYQVAGTASDGGQIAPTAHVFRSDTDGGNWTESSLATLTFGSTPIVQIEGVDPANPDIIFIASVAANGNGDRLYRSSDGAQTWTEVLATTDVISGFVIYDAQTVFATTAVGGSFVSHDGGRTFTPLAGSPQLACLGKRGDGALLGCGTNWVPDYMAIGKSADIGATWQKVWRFVELAGPLTCPAGTSEHDDCQPLWPSLQAQFGASGPTCGMPQVDGAPQPPKKKGCCDAGGSPVGLVWAGAIAFALARRRRDRVHRAR